MRGYKYTKKEALKLQTKQLVDDLLKKSKNELTIALIQEWEIKIDDDILSIQGKLDTDINPKTPIWMTFERDSEDFSINMDCKNYLPEALFLILEVWESKNSEGELSLSAHLEDALNKLATRWKGSNEPLSEERQRGLIGELEAILYSHKIVKNEAIKAWDPESKALHDLTSDQWSIEAKSIGTSGKSVMVSRHDQLKWDPDRRLVLSVTKLKQPIDGKIFPEIVEELLRKIKDVNSDDAEELKQIMATIGYNDAIRNRFIMKWEIIETCFYLIEKETPAFPCKYVKNFPKEVFAIKYSLNISKFKAKPLEDILIK
jgi:hypothetical protein